MIRRRLGFFAAHLFAAHTPISPENCLPEREPGFVGLATIEAELSEC